MSKQNVIGFWSEKKKHGFMSQWYLSKFTVDENEFTIDLIDKMKEYAEKYLS